MTVLGTLRYWLAVALAAGLVGHSATAGAAKDTPWGAELIVPGYPNITMENVDATLDLIAGMGSFSSMIWWWSNRPALDSVAPLVNRMHDHGLEAMIQIGPTWLGAASPPTGLPKSFGNFLTRMQFLADVEVIARAKPDYLVLVTEANLTYRFARDDWGNLVSLYAEAYKVVKRVSPNTKVGASWLYALWYANYYIDNVDVPAQLAPADFYAFTTYPEWLVREGHYPSIADIPPEFHGKARLAYPNKTLIVSEIGWPSKGRIGTPELQAEFVRNIPRILSQMKPAKVSWAMLSDLEFFNRSLLNDTDIALLESIGVNIDEMFEHFNAMGLMDGYANPKPALNDAFQLQFAP